MPLSLRQRMTTLLPRELGKMTGSSIERTVWSWRAVLTSLQRQPEKEPIIQHYQSQMQDFPKGGGGAVSVKDGAGGNYWVVGPTAHIG